MWFCVQESSAEVAARLSALLCWLAGRPESSIAIVGHSGLFRRLCRDQRKMKNCELRRLRLGLIVSPSAPDQLPASLAAAAAPAQVQVMYLKYETLR